MKYVYSYAQVRKADETTIKEGTPSRDLMERAGRALADAVKRAMKEKGISDALFVCGGGNNGGDGFAAAQFLVDEGEDVQILCLADKFSPDSFFFKEKFSGELFGRIPRRRYALIVDCLLGTGITHAPEGNTKSLIDFINTSGAYVVSCDVPSGLLENGVACESCVEADETVTMGLLKRALYLADGVDVAGKVTLAQIGVQPMRKGAEVWEDFDVKKFFPRKRSNVNKGTYGKACIFGGSAVYSGASFLAAGACLKTGAGYTKLVVGRDVYRNAIGRLPAVILQEFEAVNGEILASDAIAAGMGAGVSGRLYAYLVELLGSYTGTLILDADALTTVAAYGTDVLKNKSCRVVLTPHPKEFARLIGKTVEDVLVNSVKYAKEFAKEFGVILVLKNNRTVITDGERVCLNPTGSSCLAKGGSGDVLTGFLTGTCARGVSPFEAAVVSAYVLGRAGELAEEEMGQYAPDASDIIAYLSRAMRSLEL